MLGGRIDMNELTKKVTVIFLSLIFISSAVTITTASNISVQTIDVEEKTQENEITLLRYGPDGSVTPVTIQFEVKEGQELIEALIEKCQEIFDNDVEFQNFFKNGENETNSSFNYGQKASVISYGRGFHFKTKFRFSFLLINRILAVSIPKILVKFNRPTVFCRYTNDSKAKTTIRPNQSVNTTQVINGSHSVILTNFVGFTLWSGRFQKSRSIPRLIIGKAKHVVTHKI